MVIALICVIDVCSGWNMPFFARFSKYGRSGTYHAVKIMQKQSNQIKKTIQCSSCAGNRTINVAAIARNMRQYY